MLPSSDKNKTRPNFLVIGAQKCGTTWLSSMICNHPEVSKVSKKEIHYFSNSKNFIKGEQWYANQFTVSPCTKAIGEYTPNYFWTFDESEIICQQNIINDIPRLIYKFNPEMKLIVVLRNPVDRAISAFYHHIRAGRIAPKQKLRDALDKYGILSMGFYDIHLTNWLKYFTIENILILIYEYDLPDSQKLNTIKNTYRFIGVNENYIPENVFKKYNAKDSFFEIRAKYHFGKLGKIISMATPGFIKNHKIWRIEINPDDKRYLSEIYKPYTLNLEKNLNQKLPW